MEFLNDYIVLVILGICLCVGYIIKHLLPGEKINRFIPAIMGILGVFLNIWLNDMAVNPKIILAGLVSGLASTGLHQVFKEFILGFKEGLK